MLDGETVARQEGLSTDHQPSVMARLSHRIADYLLPVDRELSASEADIRRGVAVAFMFGVVGVVAHLIDKKNPAAAPTISTGETGA